MKMFRSITFTFVLTMISHAVGHELAGKEEALAGHWALRMSNGAAGWMALELNDGEWSG
jgi:hypothetical protein